MILARVLSRIYKKGGIILIDAKGQKYICGNPKKEKPITLKLLNDKLNWKLVIDPEIEFPEAYMRKEIIIENASLKDFLMELIKNLGRDEVSTSSYISKKIFQFWRYLSNYNLPGKSRKDIEHHYDIGGDKGEKLYDIFLDTKHRLYSCAYWKDDTKTLEEAQQNKINHIIKKLDIKKNQKILEVGCGWGGMVFEIAKQKNCEVTGISLSKNQINYCKNKAKELGLNNQVKFELVDYREIKGQFDRIYSVGMFEHVGRKFYKTFFKSMNNLLKNDGVFLLHTIGVIDKPSPQNKFINKYIFPGGVCPSFSQIIEPIEKTGLIVSDTETLIRHYDKTLEHWLLRFLDKKNLVKDLFDEKFVKMWEFYLASCAAAFRYRDLVVFQLQIVKNFQSAHRTRDYIYS
ncbi:cyclopropane-fatty-acyl-phospholipid synthase family protein [Pelagibacteraceae bacterium]|nr:cyclopropane-fatty-acyl-phospholipid synthase family protein [Pelagibacteraceae bacterium]|tara:strand:+ start:2237 stop:3442 length:1206 start_codon:yes stop_codon:yes gene_type:complete